MASGNQQRHLGLYSDEFREVYTRNDQLTRRLHQEDSMPEVLPEQIKQLCEKGFFLNLPCRFQPEVLGRQGYKILVIAAP
ncbi:hypothetical protein D3C72_2360950 [compost metagenome]